MRVSPSLLSSRLEALGEEVALLQQAGVEWVHWDIMDGRYVPNCTFGAPVVKACRSCAKEIFFDVHLMIQEPERYVEDFIRAGANALVIHPESTNHPQRVLSCIREAGVLAGIALNPHVSPCSVEYLLEDIDILLVMSVNPGFSGQSFIPSSLEKIRRCKAMLKCFESDAHIQVDGGITPENVGVVAEAGASIVVSGSSFFASTPHTVEGYRNKAHLFQQV